MSLACWDEESWQSELNTGSNTRQVVADAEARKAEAEVQKLLALRTPIMEV
jgi:hypothetical protein